MTRLAPLVFVALAAQAAASVIDWESITEQQFRSLPVSQPVKFEGRQTTLGALRPKADARLRQAGPANRRRPAAPVSPGPRPAIDQVLRQQRQRELSLQAGIAAGVARLRREKAAAGIGSPAVPYNTHVPVITNVFAIVEPGGAVLIDGKNFGATAGRVRLVAVDASWSLELEDLEWFPGGIAGTLPKAPKVTSLAARFIVDLRSGASSQPWPVQWITDVKMFPAADVAVTCGTDGNKDFCNSEGDESDFCTGFMTSLFGYELFVNKEPWPMTVEGIHENCWGAFGTDKGTDVYQIAMKNGWTLYDVEFRRRTSTGASITGPKGFTQGATSWALSVDWFAQPDSVMWYGAIVYIRGPKGIPHR